MGKKTIWDQNIKINYTPQPQGQTCFIICVFAFMAQSTFSSLKVKKTLETQSLDYKSVTIFIDYAFNAMVVR